MKEFIEKLISGLEDGAFSVQIKRGEKEPSTHDAMMEKFSVLDIKKIVNELAEEFGTDTNVVSRNGWIPCGERLPEDNTNVIACFATGTVTELKYIGAGIFEGIYDYTTKVIIAWQPLPAPYKEGE